LSCDVLLLLLLLLLLVLVVVVVSLPHTPSRTSDRLLAASQLGIVSLALAAAEKLNGPLPAAEW
jgi:hypothetical protein